MKKRIQRLHIEIMPLLPNMGEGRTCSYRWRLLQGRVELLRDLAATENQARSAALAAKTKIGGQ